MDCFVGLLVCCISHHSWLQFSVGIGVQGMDDKHWSKRIEEGIAIAEEVCINGSGRTNMCVC